ncbi:MAG TPA: hypothetical protein VFE06_03050 [Acidobacteriaceae bacterium]|jgi:hypothetical protein|nr:hypothetical protein [Acidobacteriaceae bacterium]
MHTWVRRALLVPLVVVSGQTCLFAQQDANAQAAQVAQKLVAQYESWGAKISTPGASITAKLGSRDGSVVRYNLYVTGLPADRLYNVVAFPVTEMEPVTVQEGVSLGKDGMVMCTGKQEGECDDPSSGDHGVVTFALNPARGEPFRFALVNESLDLRAAVVIIPDPILATDKNCTLSAVRLMPHFEVTYFSGTGHPPDADVTFASNSWGEKHTVKTRSDGNGAIRFAMMPAVAGHSGGTTGIKGVGMACAPSLKFDWGR